MLITRIAAFFLDPERPESVERAALGRHIQPGNVVIEAGARTGRSTRLISSLVGAGGVVIAVEPNPYCIPRLVRIARNLHNVRILNMALGDRTGSAPLWTKHAIDPAASIKSKGVVEPRKIIVKISTLDDLLAQLPRVTALIIDAEGAEVEILRGARQTLKSIRMISVEIHNFLDESIEKQVNETLLPRGFVLTEKSFVRPAPCYTTLSVYCRQPRDIRRI
jgi:FkbM family methyltransferase